MSTPSNTASEAPASSTLALGETLAKHAITACEAVRAINHATITRPPLPAPIVYELLGALSRLGYALDQALVQIGTSLAASLEAPGLFEVYEADGSDPATSVANARASLGIALVAADDMATAVENAQGHLAWQGFRPATRSTTRGDR
jgi:hypothetical protein